ncbi:hypothetical protein K4K61_004521 [Colletotrichum sp. SAR11_59]|uniref:DUF1295 domain-containing protein n=1 Tax=Colletotrichum asianum TaxID=702518 RepID=A0A8H3WKX0_9PEZI|nr:hypothetical protein GQ607_006317 [Colletotrichum asianum]KAI8314529.1 hypothetical protein K4K61_004521 [Colletotrichum sp. SAR11_59]
MALPSISSLEDCSDWAKAAEPFIPQLLDLPRRIAASPQSLPQIYLETNPLVSGFAFSLFIGFLALVVSEYNRNYSQIDRLWSLLPNWYIVHMAAWAHLNGIPAQRLILTAVATTLWSGRLTFNYWRKGGYERGSEDYRWEIVRKQVPAVVFFVFNVTFISFIQSILLFAFSAAPAYSLLLASRVEPAISAADWSFFSIIVALVLSEYISDGQQWDYQTAKHSYLKDKKVPRGWAQEDLDRGFVTGGLWAYSRHPNFFAEQMIWFVLYQWSCYATKVLYSYTFAGSAFLIMLFQGSTWLTELITSGKYAEYSEYQKQVGMFMPTSVFGYRKPQPKIIKTSELAKRQTKKDR